MTHINWTRFPSDNTVINLNNQGITEMSWKAMIPDLLVVLLPVVTGITLVIVAFDIFLLSAVIVLIALTTFGNGFIRGKLTCRHCKQRELGCPAERLFNKG